MSALRTAQTAKAKKRWDHSSCPGPRAPEFLNALLEGPVLS